jgi:trimeric autotransporter adhesin
MNAKPMIGLFGAALFSAAPALADPVNPLLAKVQPSETSEPSSNTPIERLSQMKIVPRTLVEFGVLGDAIAPAPLFFLSDNIILPSGIILVDSLELFAEPMPVTPQVGARFTTQGAGTDAFVGIEGFVPISQKPGQSLTYLEGRLQISTENAALGSNILVGHRFLSESKRHIVGGYLAYDRRNTGDASFNQFGAGLESLSETFDARANVYLPLGKSSRAIGDSQIGSLNFQGNELNIERLQAIQEALPGFDFEIGTRLFKLGKGSVRGYIGGYYYGGDQGGFAGLRSRLVARPTDMLTASLALQTDSRFDTRLIFSLGVQFPGSGATRSSHRRPDSNITIHTISPTVKPDSNITINPNSKPHANITRAPNSKPGYVTIDPIDLTSSINIGPGTTPSASIARPKRSLLARLAESPERQASILVDQYVSRTVELAINPATGQPWRFQFVNLGIGTGDGTFEAPAGTVAGVLPTARSGGIVYVAAGTNPGIPGFAIPDGVSVISNAVITPIATQFGFVPLPNGGTDNRPLITSTITLGNDTRLTGFEIANSPGVGVFGQNIRNVILTDHRIANSGAEGIRLDNITGTVLISKNEVNGTAPNNSPSQSPGILLNNTTGAATVAIADNTVSNTSGTGIVVNAAGTAEIAAIIENNQVNRPGFNGILSRAEGNGKLTAQITNNEVTGTASSLRAGIGIGSRENGSTTGTVSGNQVSGFTNPDAEGIRVFAEGSSQTIAAIAINTITDNRRGILVTAGTTSRVQTTLENNTVIRNLEEGIWVTGGIEQGAVGIGSPQVAAILRNNRITDNQTSGAGNGDAVGMSFSPGTRVCLQLTNNQIGTLTLADIANPALGAPFNASPLSLLSGLVSVELPVMLTNSGTNEIARIAPATSALWSRTNIPAGTCQLP